MGSATTYFILTSNIWLLIAKKYCGGNTALEKALAGEELSYRDGSPVIKGREPIFVRTCGG